MFPYQLYGHKRSGTNVIDSYLKNNFNLGKMSAKIDPKNWNKDSILWKHCRIDLVNENGKLLINSVNDLDRITFEEYNKNNKKNIIVNDYKTKYIVVYKDIFSWLPSICRWSRACKWKKKNKLYFVDDYFNYMYKWYLLQNDNIDKILFINYEEFFKYGEDINSEFVKKIERFTNFKIEKPLVVRNKVECSGKFDNKKINYYKKQLYMKEYNNEEIKIIKNHKYYSIVKDTFFK